MGNNSSSALLNRLELSPHAVHETQEYELYDANDGYKRLSLFVFKSYGDSDLINFSAWKSLRHPLILQYLDTGVIKGHKCVLTEYVIPLTQVLDNYSKDEVICGLQEVSTALDFLHSTCFLSHNNLSLGSIFVSRRSLGSWKIGCPQLMSTPDEETFDFVKKMVGYKSKTHTNQFLPPEDATADVCQPIPSVKEIHRRDSFALGCLMEHLLLKKKKIEEKEILSLISRLKCLEKENRPVLKDVLSDAMFKSCQYLKFKQSLTAFGSYSEDEKKTFIASMIETIKEIPESLLSCRIIPMILTSRLVMLHPESKKFLHPFLLNPAPEEGSPVVSVESFETFVIPVIVKLFAVKKINVRLILLEYLPFYVKHIPLTTMQRDVLPQIQLGLRDENDVIVAATYTALSTLVQTFGADALQDKQSPARKKIFCNDLPGNVSEKNSFRSLNRAIDRNQDKVTSSTPKRLPSKHDVNGTEALDDDNGPGSAGLSSNHSWREDNDQTWLEWGSDGQSPDLPETEAAELSAETTKQDKEPEVETLKSLATKSSKSKRLEKNQELDIKAIEFDSYPEELNDMFSAMEPRVNFPTKVKVVGKKGKQESSKSSNGDLFAVKNPDNQEDDGWIDEEETEWVEEEDINGTAVDPVHPTSVVIEYESESTVYISPAETPDESPTPYKTPDRTLTPTPAEKQAGDTVVNDEEDRKELLTGEEDVLVTKVSKEEKKSDSEAIQIQNASPKVQMIPEESEISLQLGRQEIEEEKKEETNFQRVSPETNSHP